MAADQTEPEPGRAELLRLRARVVVAEKMAMAALELALRIRPEELRTGIEVARSKLSSDYEDTSFASDMTDPAERAFVAREVDRLMRGLQADLGFQGGVPTFEDG